MGFRLSDDYDVSGVTRRVGYYKIDVNGFTYGLKLVWFGGYNGPGIGIRSFSQVSFQGQVSWNGTDEALPDEATESGTYGFTFSTVPTPTGADCVEFYRLSWRSGNPYRPPICYTAQPSPGAKIDLGIFNGLGRNNYPYRYYASGTSMSPPSSGHTDVWHYTEIDPDFEYTQVNKWHSVSLFNSNGLGATPQVTTSTVVDLVGGGSVDVNGLYSWRYNTGAGTGWFNCLTSCIQQETFTSPRMVIFDAIEHPEFDLSQTRDKFYAHPLGGYFGTLTAGSYRGVNWFAPFAYTGKYDHKLTTELTNDPA